MSTLPIIISSRQLLTTLLDLHTVSCGHLTIMQRQEAVALFEKAYVKFALQHRLYERQLDEAKKTAALAAAVAATAAEAAPAAAAATTPSTIFTIVAGPSAISTTLDGRVSKRKLDSCSIIYGQNAEEWTDDDSHLSDADAAGDSGAPDVMPEPSDAELAETFLKEGKLAFKHWRKLEIDWKSEFPEELRMADGNALDMVDDLMSLLWVKSTARFKPRIPRTRSTASLRSWHLAARVRLAR
eukprot:6176609-Pleurochrysis_carterae.AAC.2